MSIRLPFLERENLLSTWRSPLSFTALIPVAGCGEPELRAVLDELAPNLEQALARVDDLHSFRLVVVPETAAGVQQLHVLMNAVHDRPLDEHFQAVVDAAGPLLAQAFTFCGISAAGELPALWKRHRVRQNTMHIGTARRSLADIRLDLELREEIGTFADRELAAGRWPADTSAEKIRRDIREHILTVARDRPLPTGPTAPPSALGRGLQFIDFVTTFGFPAMGTLSTDITNAIDRIGDRGRRALTRLAYRVWWLYAGIPTGLALAGVR
ncbi:MAG: hypothetical protein ACREH8_05010, partial [Opitutaceae bacterium]